MRFLCNKLELDTAEKVEEWAKAPRDIIGVDIETVSLDNRLPLGIGVALSDTEGLYFFDTYDSLLHDIVVSAGIVVAFNASFDIPALEKLGHPVKHFEDSMLKAYANGILYKNLEDISNFVLSLPYTSVRSQWKKSDQGNINIDHVKMGGWCLQHALNALVLWNRTPLVPLYQNIDRPCIDLVIEMQRNGLLINQYTLTQVEQEVGDQARKLEYEVKEELGFPEINLASNPQVAAALQLKGIIGTRKTGKGADSVSDDSLKPLHNPLADKILKHRSLMKTLTTYVPAFRDVDHQGKIHTDYGYTDTGRWNSSNPNLQNLTRDEKFEEEA